MRGPFEALLDDALDPEALVARASAGRWSRAEPSVQQKVRLMGWLRGRRSVQPKVRRMGRLRGLLVAMPMAPHCQPSFQQAGPR